MTRMLWTSRRKHIWESNRTGGLVAKRIDETSMNVEEVVQMTGAVIAESCESHDEDTVESIKDK